MFPKWEIIKDCRIWSMAALKKQSLVPLLTQGVCWSAQAGVQPALLHRTGSIGSLISYVPEFNHNTCFFIGTVMRDFKMTKGVSKIYIHAEKCTCIKMFTTAFDSNTWSLCSILHNSEFLADWEFMIQTGRTNKKPHPWLNICVYLFILRREGIQRKRK